MPDSVPTQSESQYSRRARLRVLPKVYLLVRREGHGWWRALGCCRRVYRGRWEARDIGEMRAQLAYIASLYKRKGVAQ